MEKKRLCKSPLHIFVYPATTLAVSVVRFLKQIRPEISADAIVLPPCYNCIGDITNRYDLNLKSISESKCLDSLSSVDGILILPDPTDNLHISMQSKVFIETALSAGKCAMVYTTLLEDEIANFKDIAAQKNGCFSYYKDTNQDIEIAPDKMWRLIETASPPFTVFVCGVVDNTYDTEIALSLLNSFRLFGIHTLAFLPHEIAPLFGQYKVDLTESLKNEKNIETAINHSYANILNICKSENPEIIIVQIPQSLMKFSDTVPAGYGVVPFLYSSFLHPDLIIGSIPTELVSQEMLNLVDEFATRIFNCPIDCYCPSNYKVDILLSNEIHALQGVFDAFSQFHHIQNGKIQDLLDEKVAYDFVASIIKKFTF